MQRQSAPPKTTNKNALLVAAAFIVWVCSGWQRQIDALVSSTIDCAAQPTRALTATDVANKTGACFELPQAVRRSGMFFRDPTVQNTTSPTGIVPAFGFGSEIRPKLCKDWIRADAAHYQLILERFGSGGERRVSFDVGANRGFYTYYLAALGMDVHAFEINAKMFHSLQQGLLFNPLNVVSDRVHLYPMGISDNIGIVGQAGEGGGGFIRPAKGAKGVVSGQEIVAITIDCFVQHVDMHTAYIDFVKVDVEGFEIAVLKGAHGSLFGYYNIGAMLIEIGPNRWNRAGITLESGIEELVSVSRRFEQSYVLIRAGGVHSKSCPSSLAEKALPNASPARIVDDAHMFALDSKDWTLLLSEMDKLDYDCNFWFSNG